MAVDPSRLVHSIGALTADAANKSVEDALSGALQAAMVLLGPWPRGWPPGAAGTCC